MNEQTIIIHKGEDPFSRVPKIMLEDARISWKAKGILSYLIGKPNDWVVQVKDIVNHGSDGRDSVRSAIDELKSFGYAKSECIRTETGEVLRWVTTISDRPIFLEKLPDPDFPDLVNPDLDNPTLTKIEEVQRKNITNLPTELGLNLPKKERIDPKLIAEHKSRIGSLYNRRESTRWSESEEKALRRLEPIPESDLQQIERYYKMRLPEGSDYRRRDLITLLNNWNGELDRSRRIKENKGF